MTDKTPAAEAMEEMQRTQPATRDEDDTYDPNKKVKTEKLLEDMKSCGKKVDENLALKYFNALWYAIEKNCGVDPECKDWPDVIRAALSEKRALKAIRDEDRARALCGFKRILSCLGKRGGVSTLGSYAVEHQDIILAALSGDDGFLANIRLPWTYCPECGSKAYNRADWNNENECIDCKQSWFPDIDYSETVRENLYRLKSTALIGKAARDENGVKMSPELYQVCICAWNNVPQDNAAMKKYTDENWSKTAVDGWTRVANALRAALSEERAQQSPDAANGADTPFTEGEPENGLPVQHPGTAENVSADDINNAGTKCLTSGV